MKTLMTGAALLAFGATPMLAQSRATLDTAAAAAALDELASACRREGGSTWRQPVCGRFLLIHFPTRTVVANTADTKGRLSPWHTVFVGPHIDSMGFANTSIQWDGALWATARLPLPADAFARVSLLAHESFHRLQPSLGLSAVDRLNAHLDERDGRYWLRFELRALAAAIVAPDADVDRHARDAVLFRAERQRLYPGADSLERSLEIQEGLAEYTGQRVARLATGAAAERIVEGLKNWQATPSYTRSFAYGTGPAIGFVLDRVDPRWRTRIVQRRDLAGLLADAVGRPEGPVHETAVARAATYAPGDIAAEEDQREQKRVARLAELTRRFVDGPLLIGRQPGLSRSFNPNNLIALPAQGTVYPTGVFESVWGKLTVDSVGVLVALDFSWIHLEAPRDTAARPLRGAGWTLELAPGWTIQPSARRGDFELKPPR